MTRGARSKASIPIETVWLPIGASIHDRYRPQGPYRGGKTTVTRIESHGFVRGRFAGALKRHAARLPTLPALRRSHHRTHDRRRPEGTAVALAQRQVAPAGCPLTAQELRSYANTPTHVVEIALAKKLTEAPWATQSTRMSARRSNRLSTSSAPMRRTRPCCGWPV